MFSGKVVCTNQKFRAEVNVGDKGHMHIFVVLRITGIEEVT